MPESTCLVPRREKYLRRLTRGLLSQYLLAAGAIVNKRLIQMAQVLTAPTVESTTTHNRYHGLPPFAVPMLVLFGVYMVWLLIAGIVLYIIA